MMALALVLPFVWSSGMGAQGVIQVPVPVDYTAGSAIAHTTDPAADLT